MKLKKETSHFETTPLIKQGYTAKAEFKEDGMLLILSKSGVKKQEKFFLPEVTEEISQRFYCSCKTFDKLRGYDLEKVIRNISLKYSIWNV